MDYRDTEWFGPVPDPATLLDDWNRTVIRPVPIDAPQFEAVTSSLRTTHVNGGAVLGRFEIEAAPQVRWFLSRNRFDECDFFTRFFTHPNVVAALPELTGIQGSMTAFAMEDSFTIFGRLAGHIAAGGAYHRFQGSEEVAIAVAQDFLRAASSMSIADTGAWVNWEPWCAWFMDVCWDATFLWWDRSTGIVTLLMITDTD